METFPLKAETVASQKRKQSINRLELFERMEMELTIEASMAPREVATEINYVVRQLKDAKEAEVRHLQSIL